MQLNWIIIKIRPWLLTSWWWHILIVYHHVDHHNLDSPHLPPQLVAAVAVQE